MKQKIPTIAALLPELRATVDQVSIHLSQAVPKAETRCFVFAGIESGVGTTVLAAATAMKMALYDRESVLLVETDICNPRLSAYLRIPSTPGFSEILKGGASPDECMSVIPDAPTLRAIPAGLARERVPGELVMENGRAALERIRQQEGFVLLDAAPITESPETKTLCELADGILLVTRARSTRKNAAKKAIEAYEMTGTPVLGVVLNRYKPERVIGF